MLKMKVIFWSHILLANFFGGIVLADSDIVILPVSITECDVTGEAIPVTTKLVDAGNGKALSGEIDLPYDFDEDFTFSIDVAKFEAETWLENVFNLEGEVCDYIDRHISKLWEEIRQQADPPIENDCDIKAGKYKLDGFQCDADNVKIDNIQEGKFKLTLKVFTPEGDNVVCKIVEVEAKKA